MIELVWFGGVVRAVGLGSGACRVGAWLFGLEHAADSWWCQGSEWAQCLVFKSLYSLMHAHSCTRVCTHACIHLHSTHTHTHKHSTTLPTPPHPPPKKTPHKPRTTLKRKKFHFITLNSSTHHDSPIWNYWRGLPRVYCIVLMAAVTAAEFVNRGQPGENFRLLHPSNWLFARANWNCSQLPARLLGN